MFFWCMMPCSSLMSFVRLINHQIEDNKKYEVAVADDSAATCSPEGGTQITCAETHKCCTSKRSYLAGTAHESQPRLALYAICCPLDTHCKFDTIFVSCAPGAGPDDYSGVIAGWFPLGPFLTKEHLKLPPLASCFLITMVRRISSTSLGGYSIYA